MAGATVYFEVPMWRVQDHSRCCGWCNCIMLRAKVEGAGPLYRAVAGATVDCDMPKCRVQHHSRSCDWCYCRL